MIWFVLASAFAQANRFRLEGSTMFCNRCRIAYDADVQFCDFCGMPLALYETPVPPQHIGSPREQANPVLNPVKHDEDLEHLKGLGGWLIVVGIGLLFGLVYRSFIILHLTTLFTKGTVRLVTDPRSAGYMPGYAGIVKLELGAQVAFLAFTMLLAILFVRESRVFPRCWVAFLVLQVVYSGVDHGILGHAITGSPLQLQQRLQPIHQTALSRIIIGAIAATIWVAYAFHSRRVKVTFVR
jgi:hypothetical protein